jgi:hypothetical protein
MNSDHEPSGLGRLLPEGRMEPRRNPHFRTEVWGRIEAAKRVSSWTGYARAHAPWVAGVLALAIVLGAIGGREEARAQASADRSALASAYVHALDARWMRQP